MIQSTEKPPALYEQDETAWLDLMAGLARDGRHEDLDLPHLSEYLSDMAWRDRHEVAAETGLAAQFFRPIVP